MGNMRVCVRVSERKREREKERDEIEGERETGESIKVKKVSNV